ncbi:hypothetical protein AJ80_03854 [Polytolypa hystricis UAMH7299]|uniref:Major facilitator superfamily (MFS) profile domain-containing protein n=1 Tax=Polytolypa hystricis (strain UAMH7299) TaxID=1447883 RepID=A0A2B7YF47_POLH7|nr:hypothetical protein AJ80_03854 [Polytolypa hystricis UAMH7299]
MSGTAGSVRHHCDGQDDMTRRADDAEKSETTDVEWGPGDQQDEQAIIVRFEPGDKDNPYNWSTAKKMTIVFLTVLMTLNSTLSSSMPSGSISFIAKDFNVTSNEELVLPISIFLIGYIFGPLILGPLSEAYGRRPLLIYPFIVYLCFTLGTALAPNFPALLVLRFFAGTAAAAPLAVVGGVYADLYSDPVTRGHVLALFAAGTTFGPTLSPIVSGFAAKISWRWPFWISLIFGGATMIPVLFLPETFGPVLLAKRAAALRKKLNRDDILTPPEAVRPELKEMLTVTLIRPVKMFFYEPIVCVISLYMAFVYAILYLFFQAYPIIFKGVYGMAPGIDGLPYLPLGIGSVLASVMVVMWDGYLHRKQAADLDYVLTPEFHRLTLANVGGPLMLISFFWLGWTARESIHWIVPVLAGLPFGIGIGVVFIALLNYLADSYGIFTASAMATAACLRSISGAVLPLAAKPMYARLGIGWATSLLGFIGLIMVAIPFVFAKYGERIRASSPFCQMLKQKQREREDSSN